MTLLTSPQSYKEPSRADLIEAEDMAEKLPNGFCIVDMQTAQLIAKKVESFQPELDIEHFDTEWDNAN